MENETSIEEYKRRKKLWIDALRSGKYAQTKGTLQDTEGYCCLGVLCEVASSEGIDVAMADDDVIWGNKLTSQRKVMEWAGISTFYGGFDEPINGHRKLTELNDECMGFDAIADIIESEPDGLFTWGN